MIVDSGRRHGRVHLRRRHRHPRQVIMGEPQRVAGAERRLARSPARTASRPARTGRRADPPTGRSARSAPAPDTPASPRSRLWWVNSGRISANDVAKREVHQARDAVAATARCWPDVMSRCITPRRCIPATARASPTASPISSSTASGFASAARLVPPTSASTIEPGYRGASSQLRDPRDPAQPLQHRQLVPQPPLRVRPQRLLADDRAPGQEQPSHARALALVQHFGASGCIWV